MALDAGPRLLEVTAGEGPLERLRDVLVVLTERDFGDWAVPLWPAFSDQVITQHGAD